MSSPRLRMLIQHLPSSRAGGSGPVADVQLLAAGRFIATKRRSSYYCARHGPMVLGVCRRLLHDANDVEDAFQATFLVLVTKARTISKASAVGSWLYRVALRVALRARSLATRRAVTLAELEVPAKSQADDAVWRVVRRVLAEEVQGLPARYREVFVLCHLQGLQIVKPRANVVAFGHTVHRAVPSTRGPPAFKPSRADVVATGH